jgi:D-alanyl-D-alanine carboxypeptidase
MGRWGRALGSGKLLSKKSHDLQVGDQLVGLGPLTADAHYGMGLVIYNNSWYVANPQVDGYSGIVATSPDENITVAVFSTGAQGSDILVSYSGIVFNAIGQALAPGRAPEVKTDPRG